MARALRALLVVVALLFAQHGAMLHGLAHAQHELAQAAKAGGKDGSVPALGHGADVCAAFASLAHAASAAFLPPAAISAAVAVSPRVTESTGAAARAPFQSRAPPSLS